MNTHDEDKIKEILTKIETEYLSSNLSFDFTTAAMKEYAGYIREKTIKECLGCVAPERFTRELQTNGFNECREQTINNIKELLSNK